MRIPLVFVVTLLLTPALAFAATVPLGWDAPAVGVPDGYTMYRRVGSGAFELYAILPASPLRYADPNAPNGTVCYYVTAYNTDGESAPSNTLCVRITGKRIRVIP